MFLILPHCLSLTLCSPSLLLPGGSFLKNTQCFRLWQHFSVFCRNLLMNWHQPFVIFLTSFLIPAFIFLGGMHFFSLFLGMVTINSSNNHLVALTSAIAWFSKLCTAPTSSNISNITLFFWVTSMAFIEARSRGNLLSYLIHAESFSLRDSGEQFVIALDI